jgi:hypothetical protein
MMCTPYLLLPPQEQDDEEDDFRGLHDFEDEEEKVQKAGSGPPQTTPADRRTRMLAKDQAVSQARGRLAIIIKAIAPMKSIMWGWTNVHAMPSKEFC